MNRDELARYLYVHAHDDDTSLDHRQAASLRLSRGTEWDEGMVTCSDRDDYYARADQMIREGKVQS